MIAYALVSIAFVCAALALGVYLGRETGYRDGHWDGLETGYGDGWLAACSLYDHLADDQEWRDR